MKLALRSVLVSPHFLFRVELDRRPGSTEPHPLADHELASRLSYFLWSSMPDDALFAAADAGKLSDPDGAGGAGAADAGRPAARTRWWRTSPASGC